MDLTFSDDLLAFRAEVRAWLESNRPAGRFQPYYTEEGLAQHLEWEASLFAAGYSAPGWPKEFGGLGLDHWHQLIYDEEYARLNLPERVNKMGLLHGGPTVMAHGTPEQQQEWLPRILDNSDIWCQGFSEPDAGSDLAGLRTTGRIEGDQLVLNGQKTWTSFGVIATKMFALVRTDRDAPKHRGISFVILDLDTEGVEVRPLRQLHGHAGFAEVFLTEAAVPLTNVVGSLNEGWRIAQTSLKLERGMGRGTHTKMLHTVDEIARRVGADPDTGSLERLGSHRAWAFAYEQATYELTDMMSQGRGEGALPSVLKLRLSEILTGIREEERNILGELAEQIPAGPPEAPLPSTQREYWHARAGEIFAGTTEIQKNIISETALGLPREPRP